ncbi:uncharacterized protein LOC114768147 isoform X3 [Denticeps clupeoides]|nr:uncharacterized protein LOC114768147 isoform X3 [Denticeps clupeoides]
MGGYGAMANEESLDYSVHEAWNEATNVYLLVILVSFALLMYARNDIAFAFACSTDDPRSPGVTSFDLTTLQLLVLQSLVLQPDLSGNSTDHAFPTKRQLF